MFERVLAGFQASRVIVNHFVAGYQTGRVQMASVLNTNPVVSVPYATGVSNVTTVPIVPKMTKNDPSVPKSCLVYQ